MSTGDIVTRPDWNGGRPVRILDARPVAGGLAVRYQDVNARGRAHQVIVKDGKRGGR
ncbi:hypothetical protein [Nonomuraea terrae]|uniref:hypothetical protein n=1 Tax=Nonomuraea terrae TaxID=2530383 RepID=UPI0014048381|nr:hypothetical protein [Nonomuraea terrae]